ncbi:hypothetical protein WP4S17E08_P10860 (plasmid) [Escherichia coli]|nr:hypothetical protein WP4S17E08_P10860 [Escherichia coli]
MGRRLGGIEDLIPQIAELSVLRCGDTSSVSHKMKAIVASNVLSYQLLQNIVGNLSSLHNAINKLTGAAFVAENIFNERRQKVSELIQEYQDLFTNQIEQEIINSPVSSTILGNFGSVVSEFFNKSLNKNMLFSLFEPPRESWRLNFLRKR